MSSAATAISRKEVKMLKRRTCRQGAEPRSMIMTKEEISKAFVKDYNKT